MATLFAPQVRAVQPAFIYNKQEQIGEVKIYFSLSAYNSDDDFTDNKCHTFKGRALAIVRTSEVGKVSIKVYSDDLASGFAEVTAK